MDHPCTRSTKRAGALLTVLQVGYPLAPVGLDCAGGAEQVMGILDRALVQSGYRSVTIAHEKSRVSGFLLPVPAENILDDKARMRAHRVVRDRIREALSRWTVDVVHMHGVDFSDYLPAVGVPVLATLHLPIAVYPKRIFALRRPGTYLNCVSNAQQRDCPPGSAPDVIENGIPLDLFPKRPVPKQNYALALGRICPEKGFHLAAQAARQSGVPLTVAGALFPYPSHRQYFENHLMGLLSPPHRYFGPAGFTDKIRLLAGARCLLVPSLVPETSSLVVMEAMVCGTAVIAFPAGALPELVDDGRTGFVVKDVEEMASAIRRSDRISSDECRREARVRFSADRMIARYFRFYEQFAGRRHLSQRLNGVVSTGTP